MCIVAYEWTTNAQGQKEMGIWIQRRGLNRQ